MSERTGEGITHTDFGMKLVYWLTVLMVIVGLINKTPGIAGYDDRAQSILGKPHSCGGFDRVQWPCIILRECA